ncbi:MAG: hypothetical protein AB8H47_20905 [Bacteroidia bacterium]
MNTIKRDLAYQVSTTYLEKKASYFMGGLLLIAALGMSIPAMIMSPADIGEEIPPQVIYIIIGVFVGAGWFFISPYLIDRVTPKQPLIFNPYRRGRRLVINLFVAAIFVGSFLYVFHIIPLGKDAAEMIYLVYFFDAMMAIMLLVKLFSALKLLVQARKFGKSQLELLDGPSYGLGEQVHFRVFNERLAPEVHDLNVYLRNIQETWDIGGSKKKEGKNSSGLVTEVIHEEVQSAVLNAKDGKISFTLPNFGYPTQYLNPTPIYWEIIVENEEIGFEARFFIEVV